MSFKVLVIPEDSTYNGYILKPLVSRMLKECGKPNAKVVVPYNWKAKGYEHVKSLIIVACSSSARSWQFSKSE